MAETLTHNPDALDLVKGMPTEGPVHWEQLQPLLVAIAAAQVLKLSLSGIDGREIKSGFHLDAS